MPRRSVVIALAVIGSLACFCGPAHKSGSREVDRPIAAEALARITARVTVNGDPNDPNTPGPLLTLEEFFEGNEDLGSIAANLETKRGEISDALLAIRSRPGVDDVRVEITSFDDPSAWPYSDTVWIVTSTDPRRVRGWFPETLRPDECFAGWQADQRYEPLEVPDGSTPIGCWWD